MNITNEKLKKAYDGSYYTISGAGGDINEWKSGYEGLLNENEIGIIKEWIEFNGKEMNETFELIGVNKYPDNYQFLAFPLDGLNISKLVMFKLQMRDRWFDDIVDNLIEKNMQTCNRRYNGKGNKYV